MNIGSYSIFLFWGGLLLLGVGFLLRKKKIGKTLYMLACTIFFLAFLFFVWWAVLRMIGEV